MNKQPACKHRRTQANENHEYCLDCRAIISGFDAFGICVHHKWININGNVELCFFCERDEIDGVAA